MGRDDRAARERHTSTLARRTDTPPVGRSAQPFARSSRTLGATWVP
ncbi:hypothetical protein [Ornithinimicrobium kibberense]